MTKTTIINLGLSFLLLMFVVLGFTNCSKNNDPMTTTVGQEVLSVKTLDTQTYSLGPTLNYESRLLKVESNISTTPVYAQFVRGCTSGKCPVVIISDPYSGISWSGESVDSQWCGRPNASTGYKYADENGPLFSAGTSVGTLNFICKSPQEAANIGGLFVLSDINILVVFGRFYSGRSLDDYVNEFVRVSESINQIPEIDTNRVAFFGASLGGFITLNATMRTKTVLKALVAMSPLIDLDEQLKYIDSMPSRMTSNNELLIQFQKFFDPYQRRIYAFTGGTRPANNSNLLDDFKPGNFAPKLNIPTLLIEDEWDTLIPVEPAKQLAEMKTSLLSQIWFQHATSIDYNSFAIDHHQTGEGMTSNNTYPLYMLYLYDYLIPDTSAPNLYYDYNELTVAFSQFRQAQVRGQDIHWLRNLGLKFCRSGLTMIDLSTAGMTFSARTYMAGIVTNLWGVTKSETEICDYLQNSAWPY